MDWLWRGARLSLQSRAPERSESPVVVPVPIARPANADPVSATATPATPQEKVAPPRKKKQAASPAAKKKAAKKKWPKKPR